MARVLLTDDAREDLREIKDYSVNKWGKTVAKEYLQTIQAMMQHLAANPGIDHDEKEALWPDVFSFPCASHQIYYTPLQSDISVLAILHQNRLPKALLKRKPSLA